MTVISGGVAVPSEPIRYRGRILNVVLREGRTEIDIGGATPPALVCMGIETVTFFPPARPNSIIRIELQRRDLSVDWGPIRQWIVLDRAAAEVGLLISPVELVAPRPEDACSHGIYPPGRCPRSH